MVAAKVRKPFINKHLITLKIVIFFTFIGIACVHSLNSTLPFYLGLTFDEYRLITIITPLVSALGPLIIGPLADKLAAKNPNNFGRCLRILTAVCLIISAIFYAAQLFIPQVERYEARRPLVSFGCNATGGVIFQERCNTESTCHHWNRKYGDLILTNCSYTCQNPEKFERLYVPWLKPSHQLMSRQQQQIPTVQDSDYSDEDPHVGTTQPTYYDSYSIRKRKRSVSEEHENLSGMEELSMEVRKRRNIDDIPEKVYVKPPHLCEKKINENGTVETTKCHVYTEHSEYLKVKVTLRGASNGGSSHSSKWCHYPLDNPFGCDIPKPQVDFMVSYLNSNDCKPMVECEVIDPYDLKTSVLADSVCLKVVGDPDVTVTTYFALRPIASIFLLAALALLNTAIVIAVRETSTGRGEICRQYVWGALGWACTIPYLILFKEDIYNIHIQNDKLGDEIQTYLIALTVTAALSFVIAAIILLTPAQMPLSPPEWWWHTKTGMLVYPMSAIRKYCPEIIGLCIVTLILGIFWGSIHSYLPWDYKDIYGTTFTGCILLLLLFFNVDKFIEFCSHSNILIAIFALYIVRFTGLHINNHDTTLTIIMEILEPLYVTIALITVMMYMRHIIPRKSTATGQAIIIILHFCIGKFFGALIGLKRDEEQPMKAECIYEALAYIALIISVIYFILYNFILAPRCTAKPVPAPQLTLTNLSQQQNSNNGSTLQTNGTNGSYTPLRVYHNERGKKGQFRY